MRVSSIESLIRYVFVFNIVAMMLAGINVLSLRDLPKNKISSDRMLGYNDPYRFIDPKKAYQIWEQLDIFEGPDPRELRGSLYNKETYGFKTNLNYCDEHRAFVTEHPEFVFEGKNYFSNYWRSHKLRTTVIPEIGNDVYPNLVQGGKVREDQANLRVDINLYYTFNLFYYFQQVGKQFSCITQASNHIPGHDKMYRKDMVGQAMVEYAKNYESRQECFNFDKNFIKTWILTDRYQCHDFFREFNSDKYLEMKAERNVVYFRKIGANVHEGHGVFPVTEEEEDYIRELYADGRRCGLVRQNNLIQYNVYNLLLLDNRKFHIRIFLFVASTNPVIAYYHDGYARLSVNEYDPNSEDKKTFVTNIGVNLGGHGHRVSLQNMTAGQVEEYTYWTMEDITNYLVEQGRVAGPEWLDNYFRPEFKKVMIHLIRMVQSDFFKKSSVFELYGLDFVMDNNLNLWFIEANTMPLVNGTTTRSEEMMNQMLKDMFDITLGLARSRMKRIISYINMIISSQDNIMDNLEARRQEYKELTKNYFEPEFIPRSNNTFEKIIDENESGTKRYFNLIDEKCL